jgi:phospholipid/cholesterol/gamma-HCH transport system ATP-binding protein
MITIRGVHKAFDGEPLLQGIDLDVAEGGRVGIIGPAACGKSVLLKLICGLETVTSGSIEVATTDITHLREDELMDVRMSIGMLFQNYALFDFLTVGENVAFPLRRLGTLEEDEILERVQERLKRVGLSGNEDKMPAELSGGMKKRVGIARATVAKPRLVIYDEPTAGLDPVTTEKIYDLIEADQEETGCTVLAVSSDVEAITGFASDVAMLYRGKIIYHGRADAIKDADDAIVRQFVRGELEGPL